MSSLRRKLTTTRRPSMLDVPSASSTQRTTTPRPSSPSVFSRASSRVRDFYEGTFNDTTPAFQMLTPPSSSSATLSPAQPPPRPRISKLAKSFADALTTQQLSDFLVWSLYYDIVEPPSSPSTWYAPLSMASTHGWIALGAFLSQTRAAGSDSGLDLVVLHSICDRLHLHRSLVHEVLARFADPEKMAYGILALTVRRAEQARMATLPLLVHLQARLHAMGQLAGRLQPTPRSRFAAWQAVVGERVRGLLHLVVEPRIRNVRDGAPLLVAATNEALPKEVLDGVRLGYLFEVVQVERRVPVERYGGLEEGEMASNTHSSSLLDWGSNVHLLRENHALKDKLVRLVHSNRTLTAVNADLTAKLSLAISARNTPTTSTTAATPSSLSDTRPPSTPAHSHPETTSRSPPSPTPHLSDPPAFDLQLAITLSASPPALPARSLLR